MGLRDGLIGGEGCGGWKRRRSGKGGRGGVGRLVPAGVKVFDG